MTNSFNLWKIFLFLPMKMLFSCHLLSQTQVVIKLNPKRILYLITILVLGLPSCENQTNITSGLISPTDISVAENSRFVIVWLEGSCTNFQCKVYARAYDSGGVPVTGQILASPTSTGLYSNAKAAIANSGMFVIVYWDYLYAQSNPLLSDRIFCQQFSPTGAPIGPPKFIDYGTYPSIAITPNGDFNVSYTNRIINGIDNIYVQRFNNNATQVGGKILIDAIPNSDFYGRSVSRINMLCNGDFILAYEDPTLDLAYLKRFYASGSQQGPRILINTTNYNPTRLSEKPLLYNTNGSFSVTYGIPSFVTQNQEDYYINRYDANGNIVAPVFLWTNITGSNPSISGNSCGDYALIYTEKSSDNILVRYYSYADVPLPDFQVNNNVPTNDVPYIGVSSNSLVATWGRKTTLTTSNIYHKKLPIPSASNNALAGQPKSVCWYGCLNGCQKTVIIGSPAVPGYTYTWSPTSYLSNPNISQPTVTHPGGSNTFSVTYTLMVKPSNNSPCCQRIETVVVTFDKGCL